MSSLPTWAAWAIVAALPAARPGDRVSDVSRGRGPGPLDHRGQGRSSARPCRGWRDRWVFSSPADLGSAAGRT
jgi:hypothetical protein